jgi:pilus assembly protein CpaB
VKRRVLGLIVALLLAGVATFAVYQLVTTADERARQDEQLAEVFVVQGEIPAGTTAEAAIAQGLISRDQIPSRTVPPGAIGSLETLEGQVATVTIFDGEIVVAQRFGSTVAQPGGLFEIPEGLEAVTVEAEVVRGVAGYVQPQDRISLVATVDVPTEGPADEADEAEDAAAVTGAVGGRRTQYIVQDVVVLAVGERVVETEAEDGQPATAAPTTDRFLFTLAMEPEDIERAVYSQLEGVVWFTLLPALDDPEAERDFIETPGRGSADIFDR